MDKTNDHSLMKPLVFNSADWDLVQTQPFWHSFHYDWEAGRQIKARLTERGNVWGIGLWPDAESEAVAKICAEGFDYGYGTDSTNFIPEDRLRMIFAMDENEGMLDCSIDASISYDMGFKIPDEVYRADTLGEMVRQIVSLRHQRIAEGLPVKSDEELADHLKEQCVTTGVHPAADTKLLVTEVARWFLPWRLFPGLLSWLFALSLLAAVYVVTAVASELYGCSEAGRAVTRVIWALVAIAYAFWKGRGDGVQGVLYHLVLMGFSAGFLWYVMARAPVDKIVALLR